MAETNGDGKTGNLPGLYRHPESGAEIVVTAHEKAGNAMADGAVQVGFVYVGPAPIEKPKAPKAVEATEEVVPTAPEVTEVTETPAKTVKK
jgi:hypothetical protein